MNIFTEHNGQRLEWLPSSEGAMLVTHDKDGNWLAQVEWLEEFEEWDIQIVGNLHTSSSNLHDALRIVHIQLFSPEENKKPSGDDFDAIPF